MTKTLAILLALVAASASLHAQSECARIPKKPIKVSGAVCGTVIIEGLTEEEINGVDLFLERPDQSWPNEAGRATGDRKGRFKFGPIEPGTYALSVRGVSASYAYVPVTKSGASCGRRVFVIPRLGEDCRDGVMTKRPNLKEH